MGLETVSKFYSQTLAAESTRTTAIAKDVAEYFLKFFTIYEALL
jgi:hypothetical protein